MIAIATHTAEGSPLRGTNASAVDANEVDPAVLCRRAPRRPRGVRRAASLLRASVRHIAWQVLGDHQAMEDVLQEAALRAFRGLPSFRGDSGAGTWLCRIAYTTSIDHVRRRPREVAAEDDELWEASSPDPGETIVARMTLDEAFAALSDEQRIALLLVDREGLDYTHRGRGHRHRARHARLTALPGAPAAPRRTRERPIRRSSDDGPAHPHDSAARRRAWARPRALRPARARRRASGRRSPTGSPPSLTSPRRRNGDGGPGCASPPSPPRRPSSPSSSSGSACPASTRSKVPGSDQGPVVVGPEPATAAEVVAPLERATDDRPQRPGHADRTRLWSSSRTRRRVATSTAWRSRPAAYIDRLYATVVRSDGSFRRQTIGVLRWSTGADDRVGGDLPEGSGQTIETYDAMAGVSRYYQAEYSHENESGSDIVGRERDGRPRARRRPTGLVHRRRVRSQRRRALRRGALRPARSRASSTTGARRGWSAHRSRTRSSPATPA